MREYVLRPLSPSSRICETISLILYFDFRLAFLQEEEIQLSELKRRSFREALAHRMKSMGELGRVMVDVAVEALDILTQLDGPDNGFNPDREFPFALFPSDF